MTRNFYWNKRKWRKRLFSHSFVLSFCCNSLTKGETNLYTAFQKVLLLTGLFGSVLVVSVSWKIWLCVHWFCASMYVYVSLFDPSLRVKTNPGGFGRKCNNGTVVDEHQHFNRQQQAAPFTMEWFARNTIRFQANKQTFLFWLRTVIFKYFWDRKNNWSQIWTGQTFLWKTLVLSAFIYVCFVLLWSLSENVNVLFRDYQTMSDVSQTSSFSKNCCLSWNVGVQPKLNALMLSTPVAFNSWK